MAQNKAPRSMAETIVMATSFKFIGSKRPAATLTKISRRLLSGEVQFLFHSGEVQGGLTATSRPSDIT